MEKSHRCSRAKAAARRRSCPASVVAPAEEVGGLFCEDCHVAESAEGLDLRSGVRSYALDPERAKALWAKSEEIVGERF